jgi:signal transduction histidine kinase
VLIGYGHDELILEVTDNGAGLPEMASAGISHHGSSLTLAGGFAGDAGLGAGGPRLLAMSGTPGWHAAGHLPIGGSGHGIIGMRERVSLLGGEFNAGPLPGYGFQVSAHIPLPSPSPQG